MRIVDTALRRDLGDARVGELEKLIKAHAHHRRGSAGRRIDDLEPRERVIGKHWKAFRQVERRHAADRVSGCGTYRVGIGQSHRTIIEERRESLGISSAITGHKHHDRLTAYYEHERLHDLAQFAAHRIGGLLRSLGRLLELKQAPGQSMRL